MLQKSLGVVLDAYYIRETIMRMNIFYLTSCSLSPETPLKFMIGLSAQYVPLMIK